MSDNILVPIQQQTVLFYEDEITAVLIESEVRPEIYIPIRPICDYLGVTYAGQRERINRDPVLSEVVQIIQIETGRRGNPNMMCLPLKYLNGWLFGINATRVKEEVRERLIRYQKECYHVLSEALIDGRLSVDSSFDDLLVNTESDAVQAYKIAMAIARLARNQIVLEAKLMGRMDEYEHRLSNIEVKLNDPDRYISNQQASRISQAVKAVALQMGKKTGRNEFGGVYGELYRRYEITSYKELPAKHFESAMGFLSEWYQQVADDEVPF